MALTILLFTVMCIANMVIHYNEVSDEEVHLSGPEVFGKVLSKYWISIVGAFIAILFSIFVFGLWGFHTYLVHIGLTTQEKLKHIYDKYPISPYRHGSSLANWSKVVLWPRIMHTRLYHLMLL